MKTAEQLRREQLREELDQIEEWLESKDDSFSYALFRVGKFRNWPSPHNLRRICQCLVDAGYGVYLVTTWNKRKRVVNMFGNVKRLRHNHYLAIRLEW